MKSNSASFYVIEIIYLKSFLIYTLSVSGRGAEGNFTNRNICGKFGIPNLSQSLGIAQNSDRGISKF